MQVMYSGDVYKPNNGHGCFLNCTPIISVTHKHVMCVCAHTREDAIFQFVCGWVPSAEVKILWS